MNTYDDNIPRPDSRPEQEEETKLFFHVTLGASAKTKSWKPLQICEEEVDLLLVHERRAAKDGPCYLPGLTEDNERKSQKVSRIDFLVYDVDGTQTESEIRAILESLGVLAWMHSTHTHLKNSSSIKAEHYASWAEKNEEPATPTRESIRKFGLVTKKVWTNVDFDISEDVTHQNGNRSYTVHHDPIGKFRVILPLRRPIILKKTDCGRSEAIKEFKAIYHGVGQSLGIKYDHACEDPSRLYYLPSCPPSGEPLLFKFGSRDKLLDYSDYAPMPKQTSGASGARQEWKNSSGNNGRKSDDHNSLIVTDSTGAEIDLRKWDKKCKLAFDIERAVRGSLPKSMVRAERGDGGFHLECPFESNHSEPGGNGTFCTNAKDGRPWTIYCCHASCLTAERARLDYVAELIRSGHLLVADLENPELGGACSKFVLPTYGGFVVPLGEFGAALEQMNERWAVVKIGNKTRYVSIKHDGTPEFLDKASLRNYFEAAYYLRKNANGTISKSSFITAWLGWTGRREYRGYGFYPAPEGHRDACPIGYYNAYRGFSVEPKKGCWKILLSHLYRNVAQRDSAIFRWLIAWLAQMVQQPHIKPGTHIVMRGKEGVGKSKLGEWLVRLFSPNGMPITSAARLAGRFNAHFETIIFGLVEEAIWAGDKNAEGALKALATAEELDYERKGLDPVSGKNYLRLMFASNEDWVVPAASGGRRWCVLEVGDEREKDYAFFAALDEEMHNGGLKAMLHDLLLHDYSEEQVRDAPVTEALVEQRLHSYDTKRRWLREFLVSGGFHIEHGTSSEFEPLNLETETTISKEIVYNSAREHFGTDRRKAVRSEISKFLLKTLGKCGLREGPRTAESNKRVRTFIFPSLRAMRDEWAKITREEIADDCPSSERASNDNRPPSLSRFAKNQTA